MYVGVRDPESKGAIINAVEHSLSAQSMISAKEKVEPPIFPHEFSAKNTSDKDCLNQTVKFRCPTDKRFQDLSFQSQRREMMLPDHKWGNKFVN